MRTTASFSRELLLVGCLSALIAFGFSARSAFAESHATVTVVYNPVSCGGTVVGWDPAAKAAFDFAANQWGSLLSTSQTIVIHACWRSDMGENDLGSATEHDSISDFDGAPLANTLYPIALANALAGSDQNGSDPEIDAEFNSKMNWYFGTDGNVPKDQVEFASVVLHEIGHGLGIGGTLVVEAGKGKRLNDAPEVYDHFAEDASGNNLLNESIYPNNSTQLANALQSNTLFLGGAHARAAFGGRPVPIYAPATFLQGSSYSHVGEIFNSTPDGLMTWQQHNSESNVHPGWVALGILQDIGWTINDDGGPAPALVARPRYAGFSVAEGGGNPATAVVNLFANRPDIHWTAVVSSDGGWLHAGSTVGVGNSPFTLTANVVGLAAGYYWGQVQFTLDSDPTISQTVRAPLTVTGDGAPSDNLVQGGDMEGDGSTWEQVSNSVSGLIFAQEEGGKNVARSGTQIAGLGFFDNDNSYIQKSIDIPDSGRVYLVYYTRVESIEKCGYDNATVLINDVRMAQLELCEENASDDWQANILDLTAFRGQTIALKFQVNTDGSQPSALLIDDVAIHADSSPATLTVTKNGPGTVVSNPSGILCGAACSQEYPAGTVVTLTARPALHSFLVGWGGACNSTGACVTTMNSAKNVSATFAAEEDITGLQAGSDGPTDLGVATHFTTSVTRGNNISYAWNFGDSKTGAGRSPTHTYTAAGKYTVTVNAGNGGSSQQFSLQVIVKDHLAQKGLLFVPALYNNP